MYGTTSAAKITEESNTMKQFAGSGDKRGATESRIPNFALGNKDAAQDYDDDDEDEKNDK